MELLLPDSMKGTHQVWQVCVDEVNAAITDANEAWHSNKGQTVLNSRLRSIERLKD